MPFSREALQEHLKGHPPEFQPVHTLLGERPLACVDGRAAHAVAGVPGGNAGLFVLLLTALERHQKVHLPDARMRALFDAYLDRFGQFYLHSDQDAVASLLDVVEKRGLASSLAGSDLLQHPNEGIREALRALVTYPPHIGCGHLRLLMQHPAAYGTRRGITTLVIKQFFDRLWEGDDRLVFEVLEGHHAEEAVVCLHPEAHSEENAADQDDWTVPLQLPMANKQQVFVHHPEAQAYMYAQHARFLHDEGLIAEEDRIAFIRAQNQVGTRHLQLTLSHLAPHLPIFDAYPSDEGMEVTAR